MSNPNINDDYSFWDTEKDGKVPEAYTTKLRFLQSQISKDIKDSEMKSYPKYYMDLGYMVGKYLGKGFTMDELELYLIKHTREISESIYHIKFDRFEEHLAYLFMSYDKDHTYTDDDFVINCIDDLKNFILKAWENLEIAKEIDFTLEPYSDLLPENNPYIRTRWFEAFVVEDWDEFEKAGLELWENELHIGPKTKEPLDIPHMEEYFKYLYEEHGLMDPDQKVEIKSVDDIKKYMKIAWTDERTHNEIDFKSEPWGNLFHGALSPDDELFFVEFYVQQQNEKGRKEPEIIPERFTTEQLVQEFVDT